MPKRNAVLLVAACLVGLVALAARERSVQAQRLGEVLGAIAQSYYQPVNGDELFAAAAAGAVATLDEHSAYLTDEGRSDLESALEQRFGGVGLELAVEPATEQPVVVAPVYQAPAWRAGITAGDRIIAIDGRPTSGRPLRESVHRLRGLVGAPVTVTVQPPAPRAETLDPAAAAAGASARDLTLVRELVAVESVQGDRRHADGSWAWMLEGEPGVAYVKITTFGERTGAEFAEAAEAIAAEGELRGLVLDLRGNPGGLLEAAVTVSDMLLDDALIVVTRGRHGGGSRVDERWGKTGQVLPSVRVAVLIDGLTASAAEIVASSLQDARRATLVGGRTFGKGTVQSLVPLADGRGLLKLTTSEYLRPSRAPIHRRPGVGDDEAWGVLPEAGFEVAPTAEAVVRLRDWRRRRVLVPPPADLPVFAATASGDVLPREIDSVLAKALDVFASAE